MWGELAPPTAPQERLCLGRREPSGKGGRRWRTAATSSRSWGSLKGLGMKPVAPAAARVPALEAERLLQLRLGEDLPGDQHLTETAAPGRRPASGPARAHLGGSPLWWLHSVLFYRQAGAPR
jgi:hypothetical protein